MSHGIFVSAENENGEAYTKVNHVPLSSSHLGIVAEVNELSREISAGRVKLEEAEERLEKIEKIPPKKRWFQYMAAGLASGTFALMLGSSVPEAVAAFLIGFLSYVWVLFAGKHNLSKIIVNIVGGVIMTVLALCVYAYTVSADIEIGWYDGWSNYADDPGSGICQFNP